MAVDKSTDTKILNVLHSTVAGSNKLAHADEIYDEEYADGEKNQHDINDLLRKAINDEVKRATEKDTAHDTSINANTEAITAESTKRQQDDTTLDGKITAEVDARQKADDALSKRIDSINSAYIFVASVDDLDGVRNYPKTANVAVKSGSVFNIANAFTLDNKEYGAGTNVAVNTNVEADAVIEDVNIDPLGGAFDASAINSDIDALRQVVYTNHIWTNVSVKPSVGYKDEETEITLEYSSGINGATDLEPTYVVKKNGKEVQLESGSKEKLTANVDYEVTGTLAGVSKVQHGYFTVYYPIYTFASTTDTITAIPEGAVKQPVASTPAGKTYDYPKVADASYLCIAVPDGMKVNGGSSGGYDAGFVSAGTIEVDGKGNYNVYRTNLAQSAGDYSILFK